MQTDPATNAIFVDADRCLGCWMCVIVCSFGAVRPSRDREYALKCHRCKDRTVQGEAPACVEACPTGALRFASGEDYAERKRKAVARALMVGQGMGGVPRAAAGLPEGNLRLWRRRRKQLLQAPYLER